MKSNNYKGNGKSLIKIINSKIKQEVLIPERKVRRKVEKPKELGSLSAKEWRTIQAGLGMISKTYRGNLSKMELEALDGEKDLSKIKEELFLYRNAIFEFIIRLDIGASERQDIIKSIESLYDYSQIAQAARDGIIIKQEEREEIVNGETKNVKYDINMSPSEVLSKLREYDQQLDNLSKHKLTEYLALGLSLAGAIGTMIKTIKNDEKSQKGKSIVTIGAMAMGGIRLIKGIDEADRINDRYRYTRKRKDLIYDFYEADHISAEAETDAVNDILEIAAKERKTTDKANNRTFMFEVLWELVEAIVAGAYLKKNITYKENGKIDGKSFATAFISLQASTRVANKVIEAIKSIQSAKKDEVEFERIRKEVEDIISQMEEKVYPLEGARTHFDSISIKDFHGKFYPKTNYETGEVQFQSHIDVPEFSAKKGDVILISGESGSGKSTFLRLLKRGDINNRQCIELDDGEKVDSLGSEWLSFRPSMDLGDRRNALSQITRRESISQLDDYEKEKLLKIMKELKFNTSTILEELASKNYNEFSTGQQKRLALSKLFYRLDDGKSIIIVDEPVGNVEDSLIKEQLQLIVNYAKNQDVILLLTTHRIDLTKGLINKRYHINDKGVLEEVKINDKDEHDEDIKQ